MCVYSDFLNYKGIERREVYSIKRTFQTCPIFIKQKSKMELFQEVFTFCNFIRNYNCGLIT